MTLAEYVQANTLMVDAFSKPPPTAVVEIYEDWTRVDIIYGAVYCDPEAEDTTLRHYLKSQRPMFGSAIDPLCGRFFNATTLAQWIGDEGIALRLLALGSVTETWQLVTPHTIYGARIMDYGGALAMANVGLLGEFTHTPEYKAFLEQQQAEFPQE